MLVENPVDSIALDNVARPESLARKVIQPVLQHQKTGFKIHFIHKTMRHARALYSPALLQK